MAFEGLTERLQNAISKLRRKGKVSEADVKEVMREIRLALLEADVNFKVVKDFVKTVRTRAVGAEVLESLTPAQQIVKIVNEELVKVMGQEASPLNKSPKIPTIIMMVGLQGAGKTTTAGKLALKLKEEQHARPLLIAADVYRPAAVDQLKILGQNIDVPVFEMGTDVNPVEIVRQGLALGKEKKNDYIIIMEGFMDVIRADTIGITNCVATMGTAFTKQQAQIVKKMTDNIILCFDGDTAGEEATISAIEILEKINVIPKIIRLEDNMDPDDYIIKRGKEAFINKINKAMSVVEFKMQQLKKDKNLADTKELAKYIEESIKELTKIEDEILIELSLKKIASEYEIEYTT